MHRQKKIYIFKKEENNRDDDSKGFILHTKFDVLVKILQFYYYDENHKFKGKSTNVTHGDIEPIYPTCLIGFECYIIATQCFDMENLQI